MPYVNEFKDDRQQTCIKSHPLTCFLIINDHWETKDTENQHSDIVIPCNYHIGNQDKNGPLH